MNRLMSSLIFGQYYLRLMSLVVFAIPPYTACGGSWCLMIGVVRIPFLFGIQILPWYHKRSSFHWHSPSASIREMLESGPRWSWTLLVHQGGSWSLWSTWSTPTRSDPHFWTFYRKCGSGWIRVDQEDQGDHDPPWWTRSGFYILLMYFFSFLSFPHPGFF